MKSNLDLLIVKKLWNNFLAIPIDKKTKKTEKEFYIFPIGTDEKTIRDWFKENLDKKYHSRLGVV